MGYWAKGNVHAVDLSRMATPCGLSVRAKKLKPQGPYFGTNCPQCCAFVNRLRADEDARGLHDVRMKPIEEQSALIIFKLQQVMTPEFHVTDANAHAVERTGFGDEASVRPLLFGFERSLSKGGRWPTDTALIVSRFLVYWRSPPIRSAHYSQPRDVTVPPGPRRRCDSA